MNNATQQLDSEDPIQVVEGLNVLLRQTFEPIDSSNLIEKYPSLPLALGSLLESLNPIASRIIAGCPTIITAIPLSPAMWSSDIPLLKDPTFNVKTLAYHEQ